ncbi:MAG: hypothetical protein KC776_31945 [Myxococcales bacterium]|nr:hypothetical protein [Myxococcales bacterium]MCB9579114.1 hypothetical protein [Polyangiaceae bacterium]
MLRTIAIGMLAVGPALVLGRTATPITPQEPPSSLDPGGGEITFTHVRNRVIACTAKGATACIAQKEAADARTEIHLSPVASPRIAGEDQRVPVDVSLSSVGGTPATVKLGAGTWSLEWREANRHAKFEVMDGDAVAIRLSTQNGTCTKAKHECVLKSTATERRIELPKERQR